MTVDMRGDRWHFRALLTLLVFLCSASSARAAGEYRTVEVESLKITIDSEWAARTAPGYLPVRFDITNLGDARVIDIVGRGMRFFRFSGMRGGAQGGLQIRQAVRLARGDRVRFTLPVPILADDENPGVRDPGGRPDDRTAALHGISEPESGRGRIRPDRGRPVQCVWNGGGKLAENHDAWSAGKRHGGAGRIHRVRRRRLIGIQRRLTGSR